MNRMVGRGALRQYQEIDVQSSLEDANPHQLIQMLLEGGLDRIAKAKGAVLRRDTAKKCHYITLAMNIINGLSGSLDLEAGGEIADNLAALYDYMARRLLEANVVSSPRSPDPERAIPILDEVAALLTQIKSGWEAIATEAIAAAPAASAPYAAGG